MLYELERHVALGEYRWDEERARDAIRDIVADTEASFRGERLWQCHPLETCQGPGHKNLYWGAAGVIWAIQHLATVAAVRLTRDYSPLVPDLHSAYKSNPDDGYFSPVYMVGESGILLIEYLLAPSSSTLERLYAAVEACLDLPADLCFGAPGAILAANVVFQRTSEEHWRQLLQRHVDRLWNGLSHRSEELGHLWDIAPQASSRPRYHLGACHGLAGNVMALMQTIDFIPPDNRDDLYRHCIHAYTKNAVAENGYVNWHRSVGEPGWGKNSLLVQWCYGAPGMVTAMRKFPVGSQQETFQDMDALLKSAAELTWRAGPLSKGAGLCHGTAGNGYAMLAMFERTSDPLWLERARLFAMHAITQCQEMRTRYDHGRFSLWTGDLGVAVYLWQCIKGVAGMPTLDYV